MMNRIVTSFFLLSSNFLCICALYGQMDKDSINYRRIIEDFREAQVFFFKTLESNFGGTDTENIIRLFDYLAISNHKGELFKLEVDNDKFHSLHLGLEDKYCHLFPIYSYEYKAEYKNFEITRNFKNRSTCDTLYFKLPVKRDCLPFKERPINVYITFPFQHFIETNEGTLKNIFARDFKIRPDVGLLKLKQSIDRKGFDINHLLADTSNRDLLTILFWKYLAHCANYNLENREFNYEK